MQCMQYSAAERSSIEQVRLKNVAVKHRRYLAQRVLCGVRLYSSPAPLLPAHRGDPIVHNGPLVSAERLQAGLAERHETTPTPQ